jgi:hypothetical protein
LSLVVVVAVDAVDVDVVAATTGDVSSGVVAVVVASADVVVVVVVVVRGVGMVLADGCAWTSSKIHCVAAQ